MKIRTGFVSNSSSSSFVMIGIPYTENLKEKYDSFYGTELEDTYSLFGDDEYIGISLGRFYDEYGVRRLDCPYKDFKLLAEQIAKTFDVDINTVDIYYGMEYS